MYFVLKWTGGCSSVFNKKNLLSKGIEGYEEQKLDQDYLGIKISKRMLFCSCQVLERHDADIQ